jgi:hypothetical protein
MSETEILALAEKIAGKEYAEMVKERLRQESSIEHRAETAKAQLEICKAALRKISDETYSHHAREIAKQALEKVEGK